MLCDTGKVTWHLQRWKHHVTLEKSHDISSTGNIMWHLQHWKHHMTFSALETLCGISSAKDVTWHLQHCKSHVTLKKSCDSIQKGDKWCDKCDKPLLSFNHHHLSQVSCDSETYFTFQHVFKAIFISDKPSTSSKVLYFSSFIIKV